MVDFSRGGMLKGHASVANSDKKSDGVFFLFFFYVDSSAVTHLLSTFERFDSSVGRVPLVF